jgi:type II secretory pathway pseudopilin PulG
LPRGDRRRADRGFTYLGVLLLVALIGLALGAGAQGASPPAPRERGAQLLWVGHAYRAAITRYWARQRAYPQRLEELLGGPPDSPIPFRSLRRLYPDPMTNAVDWVLLPAPGGGIMGVASRSKRAPIKTHGFDDADREFEKARSYSDWLFAFQAGVIRRTAP